jgi:hypothetical protein
MLFCDYVINYSVFELDLNYIKITCACKINLTFVFHDIRTKYITNIE